MRFLGVDIGSTSIKGAVLDLGTLAVSDVCRRPFPEPVESGFQRFEIDPESVFTAVEQVLRDLVAAASDCQAILFCGQMGGVVLTDESGRALGNYLSWRDQRVMDACGAYSEKIAQKCPDVGSVRHGGERVAVKQTFSYLQAMRDLLSPADIRSLGNEIRPGSATSLLFWLQENGQLPSGAVPQSINEYVIRRLCGAAPFQEYTLALGLLDLNQRDWHHAVFQKLGLDSLQWPRLTTMWQPVGEWLCGTRSIPCHAAIGDHQCALAGALLADDELSINVSTGSQVSRLTARVELGDYQTRPYLDGRYLNTITHLPAGRSLEVLVSLVTEVAAGLGTSIENAWPTIARLADSACDSQLTVDLAFFAGTMGSEGNISHVTTDNLSVGSLFRAAFRNMAENYAVCSRRLSPAQDWRRVVLSGGLVQKLELLRRFILKQFNGQFRQHNQDEETLFGLLVSGLVISDQARNLEDAGQIIATSAENAGIRARFA